MAKEFRRANVFADSPAPPTKPTLRSIKRIAMLQDYANRPWRLKQLIPEVAAKGYHSVLLAAFFGDEPYVAELCQEAQRCGLEVMIFTGFQKYNYVWLKDHPEHAMIFNSDMDTADQDQAQLNWGCPFNPEYQKKYFELLEFLGRIPDISEVLINDEAYIGDAPDHLACYCPYCRGEWQREFRTPMPHPPFTDPSQKAAFINWRFRRWNDAHGKMKEVLNRHHPVKAVFQTSPVCCLDFNPWVSGVDLSGMIEQIDGVMTDPYYTFHLAWGAGPYMPLEIYLGENCRYLYGLAGNGKTLEMCVAGFSHPTMVRPLDKRDGWWSRVVPMALGIDETVAFTYTLQKVSPVQKPYEESFRLDSFFSQVHPVDFVAVIDSLETQCFHIDGNMDSSRSDKTWHYGYLMKIGEIMRHHGLSYVYLPGRKLTRENLSRWPVIALPGVSCLSEAARQSLKEYVRQGGVLLAFGETATRDELGRPRHDDFLAELFGITSWTAPDDAKEFSALETDHEAFSSIDWPDPTTAGYRDGAMMPTLMLTHCVEARMDSTTVGIAAFNDQSAAAISLKSYGKGKAVFFGGIPTRTVANPRFKDGHQILNHAGLVAGKIINDLAGDKNPVRAVGFPPVSPIHQLRPLDHRRIPTVEVLPCLGTNGVLVTIPSYFREEFSFALKVRIPPGKTVRQVHELLTNQPVVFRPSSPTEIEIPVSIGFDDFLQVLMVAWTRE